MEAIVSVSNINEHYCKVEIEGKIVVPSLNLQIRCETTLCVSRNGWLWSRQRGRGVQSLEWENESEHGTVIW